MESLFIQIMYKSQFKKNLPLRLVLWFRVTYCIILYIINIYYYFTLEQCYYLKLKVLKTIFDLN